MGITTHIDRGMAWLGFVPKLQTRMKRMKFDTTARSPRSLSAPLTALALVPVIPVAAALPTVAAQAASGSAVAASTGAAAFYAAAATAVGVFILLNAALRNRVGLYYAALFAIMLAIVWVLDQEGGAVPLGMVDHLERSAAMALAMTCCALGFFAAERAIAPERPMVGPRRMFRVLTGISLLLAIAVWFLPAALAVPVVNGLLAAMLLGHIVPAMTWRTLADRPFRLPVVTAAMLFVAVAVLFPIYGLSTAGGPAGGSAFDPAWLRWLFALVAAPAMAAIALAVLDLGRAREAALQQAVAAAREKADTAAALLEMEKNYAMARDVAARQTRRVSTVAHDIRQPIAALRAELDALQSDLDDVHADRFARILDHFDNLTSDLAGAGGADAAEQGSAEDIPAALLFSMLERLFATDAAAKGMELRFVPSTALFHAPPVVLTRIASNLIANAIAHSGATRILVGVRPHDERLRLVIFDNGNGFEGVDFEAARRSGVKGADSGGSGLGLSIVDELAETNGLTVAGQSVAGRGSAFSVSVARAGRG